MTQFVIEDGVAIRPKNGRTSKYPFRAMEVGQSFLVEGVEPVKVFSAACHAGKIQGRKYTCRQEPLGGVRVWRVA